jgi:hypothetical protein
LPGLTTSDIKYLSVWNRRSEENFGHVEFHRHYTAASSGASMATELSSLKAVLLFASLIFM